MGLQSFERSLERMVEGVFSRGSHSSIRPVELGRRLLREMDDNRSIDVKGRRIVPNDFNFKLSAKDHAGFADIDEALNSELCETAREYARAEGFHFMGAVAVTMAVDNSLKPGRFTVTSRLREAGGGGLASLVLLAHEWACEGAKTDTILSRLYEWIPRGHIFFLVDTLEYLQKGGRIGGAKALLGEMLQIKPILCLQNGQVEPFGQQRTKRRALKRLLEVVDEECPKGMDAHLCVMQADAIQEAGLLAEDLKSRMGIKTIPIYELPPAIVTHGGPGVLGIGYFVP